MKKSKHLLASSLLLLASPAVQLTPHPSVSRRTPSPRERAGSQEAPVVGKTWGVVSAAPLDSRIQTQLEKLAAQNQAELRSFATMDQARSAGSALSIELLTVTYPDGTTMQFTFDRIARNVAVAPSLFRLTPPAGTEIIQQ